MDPYTELLLLVRVQYNKLKNNNISQSNNPNN